MLVSSLPLASGDRWDPETYRWKSWWLTQIIIEVFEFEIQNLKFIDVIRNCDPNFGQHLKSLQPPTSSPSSTHTWPQWRDKRGWSPSRCRQERWLSSRMTLVTGLYRVIPGQNPTILGSYHQPHQPHQPNLGTPQNFIKLPYPNGSPRSPRW
jgi:ABC-type phosphate/phosphonate transport system permease subunit